MTKFYQIVKVLAVACVVPLTVFLCMFLWTLQRTTIQIGQTVKALPAQVDERVGKLQTDVLAKIDTVQDKLSSDLSNVVKRTDNRLALIQSNTVDQLTVLNNNINAQLTQTNVNFNNQLAQTNQSIATLTKAYADVPSVVSARLEPFTNCDTNDLCWQNQFSDSLFAVRTTSRDVSTTMNGLNHSLPILEANVTKVSDSLALGVPQIVANVDQITHNINVITHPHWYDRILSYAGLGVGMYRGLFPITNFTITGTQLVATHTLP